MLDRIRRVARWLPMRVLLATLAVLITGRALRPPPGGFPATPIPIPSAPVHRLGAYNGTTAKFTINGTAASPPGFDATNSQTLTLQLATNPAPDIYQTQFFIYDPNNPSSPLASLNAPVLTFTPSSGIAATPTSTVTVQMPATGSHSYKIRCVVNGGVQASTGLVIPTWTYERVVAIRGPNGLRKQLPGESTEYASRGWSDEQNRQLDAVDGLAPSAVKLNARMATTGSNIALTGLQTIDGVVGGSGDRVLAHDETDGTTDGLWVMAAGAWTRATDADASSKFSPGMLVAVSEGTQYKNSRWYLATQAPITLGATSLNFQLASAVLNVRQFGAKCDNVTDDTAAITAALAAVPSGGSLYVPTGDCVVSAHLLMQVAKVTIYGDGWASRIRATASTFNIIDYTADDITVRDIWLDGGATNTTNNQFCVNNAGGAGAGKARVRIERVKCTNVNDGFFTEIGSTDATISDNYIDRPWGAAGASKGYGVLLTGTTGFHILRNKIYGDDAATRGRHAIYITAGDARGVVADNVINGFYASSLTVYATASQTACSDIVIAGNQISNQAAEDGGYQPAGCIELSGNVHRVSVSGGNLYNCRQHGILVQDANASADDAHALNVDNTINGVTVDTPGYAGVEILGAKRTKIQNNVFIDVNASIPAGAGTYGAVQLYSQNAPATLVFADRTEVHGNSVTYRTAARHRSLVHVDGTNPPTNTSIDRNTGMLGLVGDITINGEDVSNPTLIGTNHIIDKLNTYEFYGTAAMADANTTLNSYQNSKRVILATGANTAIRNLVVSLQYGKQTEVINGTTGGFAIVVKGTSGTGVTVPPGAAMLCVSDGTNIVTSNTFDTLTYATSILPVNGRGPNMGRNAIAMSDADFTVGSTTYPNMVLEFTGVLTAGRNIIMPLTSGTGPWIIRNGTTGGFSLTVKGSSGTGVTIAAGKVGVVYTDTTNFYGVTAFNEAANDASSDVPMAQAA